MIKVSVIVPVYNVEKYLDRCLRSLVTQTLDNLEIIIVNDGTRDNSQAIIDTYVNSYPSLIKSLKKENGGLSSARNYGVAKANGEYISFVDSDDYVDRDMFRRMYAKAKEKDFDLVVCDFNEIHEEKVIPCFCHLSDDVFGKEEIKKHMLAIYPSAWNKLFKRNVFERFLFKEKIWFEDVEFIYRVLPYIQNIGYVNAHFYQYIIRDGSITASIDPRIYDYISNWNGILDFYRENNIYDEYKDILEYCYVRYIFATFIKTATKYEKTEFKKAVKEAIENVNVNFPNYKENQYLNRKGSKNMYLKKFNCFIAKIVYFKCHKG